MAAVQSGDNFHYCFDHVAVRRVCERFLYYSGGSAASGCCAKGSKREQNTENNSSPSKTIPVKSERGVREGRGERLHSSTVLL